MPESVSRRRFLRAGGLALALPSLPSLARPTIAGAASEAAAGMTTAAGNPLRMVYLYVPNGVNMTHWRPQGDGADYQLNRSTQALAPHKDDIQFVSNLENREAYIHREDGSGDHARANASFLTAARPNKSAVDVHCGISADQVVAQRFGESTRLPSLELSCDGVRKSGQCDSGYSCAYQFNLSWRDERTPIAPESSPRAVFERLFGEGRHGERQKNFRLRQSRQMSVLDFVRDEAKLLQRDVSREDWHKVDEYLSGVREIETQIAKADAYGLPPDPQMPTPADGVPDSYRDHMRLLFDVLAMALETDQTRVCSFMLAHDGSNRTFRDIGVNDAHHYLSHHKKDERRLEKIAQIDTFYCEQLAYFLDAMKSRTATGTDGQTRSLLDDSMIVYGSGLSDGDRHNQDDLPIIVAGRGGGALSPGRHLKFDQPTPMANLHLSLIQKMGVASEAFSDSTEPMAI